jgi:hypothetical protein
MNRTKRKTKFTDADLMRLFFPKELTPPFRSSQLADALGSLPSNALQPGKRYSKPARHSIPRTRGSRRLVSIPNPSHQLKLAQALAANAADLLHKQSDSTISLSAFKVYTSPGRVLRRSVAVEDLGVQRMMRAAGHRFVLRTDLSRYYATIYTHGIPWAIHGKTAAKANHSPSLYGNLIDTCVRDTQDQQTLGIPIGPKSSDLIAETVGAALDRELQERLGVVTGTRYVDDFHLYFPSRSAAESALATIEDVAKRFELEVNPLKTEIGELPEAMEPPWLTDVRAMQLRPGASAQRFDLVALFNNAFTLLRASPAEPVLKYVVKQTLGADIHEDNWSIYESLLCHTIMADSGTLPLVTQILLHYREKGYELDEQRIRATLSEVIDYHAPLNHGFEVAWALWMASALSILVEEKASPKIATMEDNVVVLVALDAMHKGWLSKVDTSRWETMSAPEELYSENWLVAYESAIQGWLRPNGDYVRDDGFFGALAKLGVTFYDVDKSQPIYLQFSMYES